MRRSLLLLTIALLPGLAGPARGESEAERLGTVEESLSQDRSKAEALAARAAAVAAEVSVLIEEAIAVAAEAQATERDLTTIETTLESLHEAQSEKQVALADQRTQLVAILSALVRLALTPPEALLAAPGTPLDGARAGLLLGQLVPLLEASAAALKRELEELEQLETEIASENEAQRQAHETLAAKRDRLETLLAKKRGLMALTEAERQEADERIASMEAEAADLRELVAALEREAAEERRRQEAAAAEAARLAAEEAERQAQAAREAAEAQAAAEAAAAEAAAEEAAAAEAAAEEAAKAEAAAREPAETETKPETTPALAALAPDTARPFPEMRSGLKAPAAAALLVGFDQKHAATGETTRGLTLATRAGAQIVAPWDGKIVYAGPFRRYGLILIIEHRDRYHSLLAGLGQLEVTLGQWVSAGEPVGLMDGAAGASPELYVELRHDGEPIDPTPWYATLLTKGEG